MKPKMIKLIELCIEDGLAYGWSRAHKYDDNPSQEQVLEAMYSAIMIEIHEWFDMEIEE